MKETYDVVIVGAGCGGLYLSQLLGKERLRVCVVESKKDLLNLSFHTLGSFIDLNYFGLTRNVVASDIGECVFHSRDLHSKKTIKGYILNKVELHKELIAKTLSHGIIIRTSTKIVGFKADPKGILECLIDGSGNEFFAKVFVDASGLSGVLSKRLGIQAGKTKTAVGLEYNAEYLGQQNQAHLFIGKSFAGGYGWIFPQGNRRAIIGYGSFHQESVARLKQKLDVAIAKEPIKSLIKVDNNINYGGTIPITDVNRKLVYKNVLCVGDSVSQVNPLVGEGYRFIMQAASIAGPYIVKCIRENNLRSLNGYETEWLKRFEKAYIKSKRLQTIANIASKSDVLSNCAVWFVGKCTDKMVQKTLSADFA